MLDNCGKIVNIQCFVSGFLQTLLVEYSNLTAQVWKLLSFRTNNATDNQPSFPQCCLRKPPLFEQLFYPVSTPPTISTKNLKRIGL